MSFSDKVVIITGGSSGIGAATAKEFAKEGALLTITGRNIEKLAEVAAECKSAGAKEVLQVVADQTKEDDLKKIMNETVKSYGKINVLVNNAGSGSLGGIEDTPIDKFDSVFHVNVKAHFYLIQLAIPHLEKTKGNVVNVSSIGSQLPSFQYILYAMAKASTDHMTKTAALELSKKDIRVNSVNPGIVRTNVALNMGFSAEVSNQIYDAEAANHPLGRVTVAVQEVVDSIVFLASDKAKAVTGTCLCVDRGRVLTGK